MNTLNTEESAIVEKGMIEYMENQIDKKANTAKQTEKKAKYVKLSERPYKPVEMSSIVTTHHKRNLSDSKRTQENERLHFTLDNDEKARKQIPELKLSLFDSLVSKDEKTKGKQFSSSSLSRQLAEDILSVLKTNGFDRKKVIRFSYRSREAKEGNMKDRVRRIKTALKAKHLCGNTLDKWEINKLK